MASRTYRLLDAVHFEGVDRGGLRFRWPGRGKARKGALITPKSEREEDVLEHLVAAGAAERVKGKKPAAAGSGEDA